MATRVWIDTDIGTDVDDALAGAIDPIECLICNAGIFLIHKFGKITITDLIYRISENSRQRFVEKFEIAMQIDFVETVRYLFYQHPVTVPLDAAFRSSCFGALFFCF